MALSEPVLAGPGAGRTVTYGGGSSAELKLVRGEEARLLITLEPAGAEYFLVPRDHSDADPAKFGLIVHAAAEAM
jgi:hypothetical protein